MGHEKKVIPLNTASRGEYTVFSLEGGRSFARKLEGMGIRAGARVEVLEPSLGKGIVRLAVGGRQFGIGRGMASRTRVIRGETEGSVRPDDVRLRTLGDYKEGQRGRVLELRGEGGFRKRLREMGFVKGAEVYVEKYAPLYDPVEYIIKGYHVSLRREEAEKILMDEPQ
jgi:Fur family ferric uptake transcriptional regulator